MHGIAFELNQAIFRAMTNIYSEPKKCGLRKKKVFSLAAQAAEVFEYTPGTSLDSVIEKLGGEIVYVADNNINKTQDGSIVIEENGKFVIHLADDVGRARQRFTIAHEIGHLVLHYAMAERKPMKANRYGTGREEWEANWFAAGFLMPEKEFKLASKEHKGYLTEIAEKLGVSYSAAKIRAKQLDLDVW